MTKPKPAMTSDPELAAIVAEWNRQKLEYPTVSRNEAGEWNYFDVVPERAQRIDFSRRGKPRREDFLDGADDFDLQSQQGEALAYETLKLAGQGREADALTLESVVRAAIAVTDSIPLAPAYCVAAAFVGEVLHRAMRAVE